jgi:hypothetical protein
MDPLSKPQRQVRALHTATTVRVYQAYNDAIADAALARGRFVSPPFKLERMTWVKPSFLWMMYRSGWGRKDEGQRRILAVDLTREGFDWALAHGLDSHRQPAMSEAQWEHAKAEAPVRIQWDPERDLHLQPLPWRSLQMGLSGEAVRRYVNEWTVAISEVTPLAHEVQACVHAGRLDQARALLPAETVYTPAVG